MITCHIRSLELAFRNRKLERFRNHSLEQRRSKKQPYEQRNAHEA
jgi:hypothetical protein